MPRMADVPGDVRADVRSTSHISATPPAGSRRRPRPAARRPTGRRAAKSGGRGRRSGPNSYAVSRSDGSSRRSAPMTVWPQLSDGSGACAFWVEPAVVVATEVFVEGAGGAHVPDRGRQRVLDGDVGSLWPAVAGDPAVPGTYEGVRVALCPHRRRPERSLQVGFARSGPARLPLGGRLVVAWSGAGSRGQVLRGREHRHVRTVSAMITSAIMLLIPGMEQIRSRKP